MQLQSAGKENSPNYFQVQNRLSRSFLHSVVNINRSFKLQPLMKQEFREKFFQDTLLFHLGAKQFKRRRNAFHILAHLVQTDPHFVGVALKSFHKIKEFLFQADQVFQYFINPHWQLPDLTSLEMTTEFLKFKVFVNTKVHEWTEKHSGSFPDLFIWKKMQSQFFKGSIPSTQSQQQQSGQETFADKFSQLKVYKIIFERNQGETESLLDEFMKIRYECNEAKKLMHSEVDAQKNCESNNNEEEEKIPAIHSHLTEDEGIILSQDQYQQDELNFLEDLLGQESTQIDAPQQNPKPENKPDCISIDIHNSFKEANRFTVNAKNMTLYRVLADNRKSLERRLIPLLEMFKVETAFFKTLQTHCLEAVQEKKRLDQQYSGRLKISKKEILDFEEKYEVVQDAQIVKLLKQIESCLKQVLQLKNELDMVQLKQDIAKANGDFSDRNNVQIVDEDDDGIQFLQEEEDPDEALFK